MYFGGSGGKNDNITFSDRSEGKAWEFIFSTKKTFPKLNLEKKIHRSNKSEKRSFCAT